MDRGRGTETPRIPLTSPHLNGRVALRCCCFIGRANTRQLSEFLEDAAVEEVRALINDSTTYPAPYVRYSLSNVFRLLGIESSTVQPI